MKKVTLVMLALTAVMQLPAQEQGGRCRWKRHSK